MANKWRVISVEEAEKHSLYGRGGWLLLLVAGMTVLGPILGAGRIYADIALSENQYPALTSMTQWRTFRFVIWSSFIAAATLSFYGGFGLLRGNDWSVVKRALAILWLSGPIATLILGVLIPLAIFDSAQSVDSGVIWALVGSVISATIWSAYLFNSRRVRVTFEHSILDELSIDEHKFGEETTPSRSLHIQNRPEREIQLPIDHQPAKTNSCVAEEFWARAIGEYENGNRRPGLWARVFSDAQGNEAVAKANYLKFRAEEFSKEHQEYELAQMRAELDAVEKAKLSALTEQQREYELLPKGTCPNCNSVILLILTECPKCRADFTGDALTWKVLPIQNS